MNEKCVYMTVLSNDRYISGVKALRRSLERVHSRYRLAVLIPEEEKTELLEALSEEHVLNDFCFACFQPQLKINIPSEYRFEDQHYWDNTFFKLRVADCTQFSKIILVDSDMLIRRNIDHLFDCPHYAAVAHSAIIHEWTKLNSGLMVIEPSGGLHFILIDHILPVIKKRFAEGRRTSDQDVFQEVFPDWEEHAELHLPEKYNAFFEQIYDLCKVLDYKHDDFFVIHFIGETKPFTCGWKANIRKLLSLLKHGKIWGAALYIRYLLYCM